MLNVWFQFKTFWAELQKLFSRAAELDQVLQLPYSLALALQMLRQYYIMPEVLWNPQGKVRTNGAYSAFNHEWQEP